MPPAKLMTPTTPEGFLDPTETEVIPPTEFPEIIIADALAQDCFCTQEITSLAGCGNTDRKKWGIAPQQRVVESEFHHLEI